MMVWAAQAWQAPSAADEAPWEAALPSQALLLLNLHPAGAHLHQSIGGG